MDSSISNMPALVEQGWLERISKAPWRVLFSAIMLALGVTLLFFYFLMAPPLKDVSALMGALGISALISLGLGFLLYRLGFARSPSLSLTLIMTYVWGAASTLFNVWALPQFMFVSQHDLLLAVILLIFAGIIATCFGVFVSASVTNGLRQLAGVARQVADGNLSARAAVAGRDEVAQAASALNEMAAQLEEAAAQRQEVEAMRRELVAWISHDLRTPLTSTRALVEALHDGVVTDEETKQRYYRTMLGDIKSLNGLIGDLFEMAQLEAGAPLEKSPQSLSDLISDAVERFRSLGSVKGVKIDGEVGSNLDAIPLNAQKIGRVLANLLDNALTYTPAGGKVMVKAERRGDKAMVLVQDDGIGFDEKDLPRLFEKFYRGEEARSRATGGGGLGLAIAKSVVEAHNGRIWVENGAHGGAGVGFELPA